MADISVQTAAEAGIAPATTAVASGGDTVDNLEGDVVILVKNGNASSTNVTITAQDVAHPVPGFGDMTKADRVVAVPAGEERMIGPFSRRAFNNAAGKIAIGYSVSATVTIAAIKVPRAI